MDLLEKWMSMTVKEKARCCFFFLLVTSLLMYILGFLLKELFAATFVAFAVWMFYPNDSTGD